MESPRAKALLFRVMAHVALAAIMVTVPAVGPNRFLLAAIVVGVGSPIAVLLNRYVDEISRNWVEALFDLVMVVSLVHFVPHLWVAAMCLGLMVALAPSVSLHPASHWIYLTFGLVLVGGMTLAAVVHGTDGWQLPIAAVTVTYPSMLYYTHAQMRRTNELRQRAQLLRGMTELAGSVAHEFNNTLTGVIGHAELALSELPKDHAAREDMNRVLNGAKQAGLLSNQLLSFAGGYVGRSGSVDISAELRTMVGLLGPVLPAGVTIDVDAPTEPLCIDARVSDLHQVLMNVILDAGESMIDSRGPIDVRLARDEGDDPDSGAQVVLTVTDCGHDDPARAFADTINPFLSNGKQSHGEVLTTSMRIMHDLGGHMRVLSRAEGGTEVRLCWPEAQDLSGAR